MPVVAVSKKPLVILDEDTGKNVTIYVRQITRKQSVEYHEITKKLGEAGKAEDAGAMFSLLSQAILMRVCDESKAEMELLMDKIGVDQYEALLGEINVLFTRGDDEKKQNSQSLTPSSSSASTESASPSKEGSATGNGETLFPSPAPAS